MQVQQNHSLNFRYAFDSDGYYLGIVRPTVGPMGETVFPKLTTEFEPLWKDGFVPRFSFDLNYWTLEIAGEKKSRDDIQKEIADKLSRLWNEFETEFLTRENSGSKQISNRIEISENHLTRVVSDFHDDVWEHLNIFKTEILEKQNDFNHEIRIWLVEMNTTLELIHQKLKPRPSLWSRLITKLNFIRNRLQ